MMILNLSKYNSSELSRRLQISTTTRCSRPAEQLDSTNLAMEASISNQSDGFEETKQRLYILYKTAA